METKRVKVSEHWSRIIMQVAFWAASLRHNRTDRMDREFEDQVLGTFYTIIIQHLFKLLFTALAFLERLLCVHFCVL